MRNRRWLARTLGTAAAACVGLALLAGPLAAEEIDQKAVARTRGLLDPAAGGRDVLSYVHFGAKYRGHAVQGLRFVTVDGKRQPGHFALVYEYAWEDDGKTQVGFLCDARGNIYELKIVMTNAVFNQPFLTANTTIKVLGNVLIGAFKDKMTAAEQRDVQKIVDDANAKGLLEWSLKFQQALGR